LPPTTIPISAAGAIPVHDDAALGLCDFELPEPGHAVRGAEQSVFRLAQRELKNEKCQRRLNIDPRRPKTEPGEQPTLLFFCAAEDKE